MARRPLLLIASAVFASAGLLVGLTDARALARFPLERFTAFKDLPRPRTMDWILDLQRQARVLDAWERPIAALAVLCLLVAFGLFAPLLYEGFRLLKPPEENPGKGASSHLDVPRLIRVSTGVFLSFWISGVLLPISALFPKSVSPRLAVLLTGGVPAWTSALPGAVRFVAEGILLFSLLWLLWAPGGLVSPGVAPARAPHRLVWGLLAGCVASPATAVLFHAREWILEAAPAFSLADGAGWQALFTYAVAGPVLAATLLAPLAYYFRPRPVSPRSIAALCVLGGCAPLLTFLGARRVEAALSAVDARRPGLGRQLALEPSPLPRLALLLSPRGRAVFSRTTDGTDDGTGNDAIGANERTIKAVEKFVRDRRYRTHHTFRSFVHLHDCASLDWLTTRTLQLDLEFLERAPSPVAAQLLIEKLGDCPITPENRKVLDRLADPNVFVWPQPFGDRWLGAAYRQYGDSEKALSFLRRANLTDDEFKSAMVGIAPLVDGTIRGTAMLKGKPAAGARIGIVRAMKWRSLAGTCRPFAWRSVAASTYADEKGVFEFRNIPEGSYVLILTWSTVGRDGGRPVAINPPGIIRLDGFRSTVTLEPFDIRFESPIRVRPSDDQPGTTSA